jgi:hypothetical protein
LNAVEETNARNQVVFGEVNERIVGLSGGWGQRGVSLFICECSDQECAEALEIAPAEYQRVRGEGARFVVVAGDQLPELERVVAGVVEKIGPAGTIARTSEPRRHV